ncbi:oligosaccharide flippase family protein [Candidatus Micrarchaeota archaeon]|nr:oligosaccharide flippase family protein [Candidatus Micrarchaeota archaeon]
MYLESVRSILRDRPLFRSNLIATSGTLANLFLAYLFHFVMTRMLLQSQYGDLSVLIGLFAVASVPAASISAVLTRELSKLEAKRQFKKMHFVLFKYLKNVTLLSALLIIVISLAALFVYNSRELQWAAAIISLGIPAAYFMNMASSYFQSKENIVVLMAIGVAREFFKLASAVLLVFMGFGLLGAAASFPAGYLVVVLVLAAFFRFRLKGTTPYTISLKKSFFILMLTSFMISAFMYLALFFVKYYLGSVSAGIYNVAEVTSKVLFYLAAGIVLVVFPKSSKLSYAKDPAALKQLIWKSSAFLLPVLVAFVLFSGPLISFFYPDEYAGAAPVLTLLAIGTFFFAIFTILLNIMWSQRQERFPFLLLIAGIGLHALLLNLLVPVLHLQGAALAVVLSSFTLLTAVSIRIWYSLRPQAFRRAGA